MFGMDLVDIAGQDVYIMLSIEAFSWLVSIQPGYLVYWLNDHCVIEPYMPNIFAGQFGYDQLYVNNPNLDLAYKEVLLDGVKAWYYNFAEALRLRSSFHCKHQSSIGCMVSAIGSQLQSIPRSRVAIMPEEYSC